MKILKYNKFKFLNENFSDNFNQMNMGPPSSILGPGYGFAIDNQLSIYGQADTPAVDQYYRTPMMVNSLLGIMKDVNKSMGNNYGNVKYDQFLEDVNEFKNLKILRISENDNLTLDIFISFSFNEEDFFGVYKKFNWIHKTSLKTDLFTDSQYTYIDKEYKLKLSNYFRKILEKWFKPQNTQHKALKKIPCRNKMGDKILIPKNSLIEVKNSGVDKDRNSYIRIKYKDEIYVINKNNYYYFNYWFEKV